MSANQRTKIDVNMIDWRIECHLIENFTHVFEVTFEDTGMWIASITAKQIVNGSRCTVSIASAEGITLCEALHNLALQLPN